MMVSCGAVLAAFGMEMFLTPHFIVPGGISGVSTLLSKISEMQLGLFLFLLNLPFVIGIRGKTKSLSLALLGLILLSLVTIVLHPFPPLVEEPPLAALLGGLLIGFGLGLVLQFGGLADGFQQAAVWLKQSRIGLSVAEIVMLGNILILTAAGLLFGWQQAIYSIFAYVVTYQSTNLTLKVLCRHKAIWVRSERARTIRERLERMEGEPPLLSRFRQNEIYLVVPKAMEKSIRSLVSGVDAQASYQTAHIDLSGSAAERNGPF